MELHMNVEDFTDTMKTRTAISLFREGKISSGLAAIWLGIPRVRFLLKAWESGAELLDDSEEDYKRVTSLL